MKKKNQKHKLNKKALMFGLASCFLWCYVWRFYPNSNFYTTLKNVEGLKIFM